MCTGAARWHAGSTAVPQRRRLLRGRDDRDGAAAVPGPPGVLAVRARVRPSTAFRPAGVRYLRGVTRAPDIWEPAPGEWSSTQLGCFAAANGVTTYRELRGRSVADIDAFWAAATEALGVRWMTPPSAMRNGTRMPDVRWFPDATLNYADQALAAAAERPDANAVIAI